VFGDPLARVLHVSAIDSHGALYHAPTLCYELQMLRWPALLAMLVAVVLLAGGADAAVSSIAPTDYLGEWTTDTSSAASVTDDEFTVQSTDETTGRTVSGANSTSFDDYCKSTYPGVLPVKYFTVATSGYGTFGGCVSGKTGGHLYSWNTDQVWYAHPSLLKGEPVLNGAIQVEHVGTPADTYKFRAHHPAVQFLTHIKFAEVIGKPGNHVVELDTISGVGEFHLVTTQGDCGTAGVVSGDGALSVRIVKIGGPNVVELDSLTIEPTVSQDERQSTYQCDNGQLLSHVAVTVTKSDPAEQDACPVGSPGRLWLADRSASSGGDLFQLTIAKCKLGLLLLATKARKGSHVAVSIGLNEKGY
jgi:hypothetical protein